MIIPTHWAEAEITYRSRHRRDARIKRMGWSMDSYENALTMAEARCQEALKAKQANPDIPWRDIKISYNGADGMPIREEVLEQTDAYTITRNGYGAACLNTPNVLFVDIDFPRPRFDFGDSLLGNSYAVISFIMGGIIGGLLYAVTEPTISASAYVTVGAILGYIASVIAAVISASSHVKNPDGSVKDHLDVMEHECLELVKTHVQQHPNWNWRVYRTPHGMRLLATHQPFDPRSDEVQACFDFFQADSLYASMCKLQNCFRARVSPKPWRMDMPALTPRSVWPLTDELLIKYKNWVAQYEPQAKRFASCRFMCEVGSGVECMEAKHVATAHDQKSQAHSSLPLA